MDDVIDAIVKWMETVTKEYGAVSKPKIYEALEAVKEAVEEMRSGPE